MQNLPQPLKSHTLSFTQLKCTSHRPHISPKLFVSTVSLCLQFFARHSSLTCLTFFLISFSNPFRRSISFSRKFINSGSLWYIFQQIILGSIPKYSLCLCSPLPCIWLLVVVVKHLIYSMTYDLFPSITNSTITCYFISALWPFEVAPWATLSYFTSRMVASFQDVLILTDILEPSEGFINFRILLFQCIQLIYFESFRLNWNSANI